MDAECCRKLMNERVQASGLLAFGKIPKAVAVVICGLRYYCIGVLFIEAV